MQRFGVFLLAAALGGPLWAADGAGEAKVRAMLKSNPVVKAAVAQGKQFANVKTCRYDVKTSQPKEFEPGTTFDYTASIECGGGESGALIAVSGRLLSEGPQALKLSIDFAG